MAANAELPAFFAGGGIVPDGFDDLMGELEVRTAVSSRRQHHHS